MTREPTRQYLNDQLDATANLQQMTVYCNLCPEWKAEGTAEEAREASAAHRSALHPELANKPRIARRRRAFSQALTIERQAEIEEERRKRMRSLGIP